LTVTDTSLILILTRNHISAFYYCLFWVHQTTCLQVTVFAYTKMADMK